MKKLYFILMILICCILTLGNDGCQSDSDTRQRIEQEKMLKEGTSQTGMPAIKNFRERKLLKEIFELRDQEGLVTYTYIVNMHGELIFLGESIGYGIPYSTQYTNPQKQENHQLSLPQADPNGLFSPGSADGTWVLLKDSNGDSAKPVFIEPRIIVSPFKLPTIKNRK